MKNSNADYIRSYVALLTDEQILTCLKELKSRDIDANIDCVTFDEIVKGLVEKLSIEQQNSWGIDLSVRIYLYEIAAHRWMSSFEK